MRRRPRNPEQSQDEPGREHILAAQAAPQIGQRLDARRVRTGRDPATIHRTDRCAHDEIRGHTLVGEGVEHTDLGRAEGGAAGQHERAGHGSPNPARSQGVPAWRWNKVGGRRVSVSCRWNVASRHAPYPSRPPPRRPDVPLGAAPCLNSGTVSARYGPRPRSWPPRSARRTRRVQSMPDVSPTKWHRAHTTWFFEEFVLGRTSPGYERVPSSATSTCSTPTTRRSAPGTPEPNAGLLTPPDRRGGGRVPPSSSTTPWRRLLDGAPDAAVAGLVELGLHHEQQHQELLLMDAKHVLSQAPLDPAYRSGVPTESAEPGPLDVDRPRRRPRRRSATTVGGFAYDNEAPAPRGASSRSPSPTGPSPAGEWLEFIDDGGYHRPELWLSDGWAAVEARRLGRPSTGERRRRPGPCSPCAAGAPSIPRARVPRQLLRGRRLRPLGRCPSAHRGRVGDRSHATCRSTSSTASTRPSSTRHAREGPGPVLFYGGVWEWTASALHGLPGIPARPGRDRRVQRQVHGQPAGPARRHAASRLAGHVRATYRNFFPPAPAGRSPASGSHEDVDDRCPPSDDRPSTSRSPTQRGDIAAGPRLRASGLTSDPKWLSPVWFYDERGQRPVRRDHPAPRVLPDPRRARPAAGEQRRDRRLAGHRPWSSSARAPRTRPGACSTP